MAIETRTRLWRDGLGLSVEEAVDVLGLSRTCRGPGWPTNGAMRLREWERGKGEPSAGILELMRVHEDIANALVAMRLGKAHDGCLLLQRTVGHAIMRKVRERAPGAEAVGPAPPKPEPPDRVTKNC